MSPLDEMLGRSPGMRQLSSRGRVANRYNQIAASCLMRLCCLSQHPEADTATVYTAQRNKQEQMKIFGMCVLLFKRAPMQHTPEQNALKMQHCRKCAHSMYHLVCFKVVDQSETLNALQAFHCLCIYARAAPSSHRPLCLRSWLS